MTKYIALDAGHGLKTAGKQTLKGKRGIIKEWTLNDNVRDYIVDYLDDYDVEFIYPDNNEGNVDESLASRVNAYANVKGIISMVSCHHNAFESKWGKHTGVEVWVDKNATADDLKLAQLIHDKLVKYTGLRGRGVKRQNWAVINQNKVTAVLVEGGFMDSLIDYDVITSADGQKAYAKAVAEALIEFHGLKKKVVEEKKETTPETATYTLLKSVNIYMNSANAKSRKKAVGKYAKGKYHVFNTANGMINITKTKGKPGAWINPADNVVESNTYTLKKSVNIYMSSTNAKKRKNAVGKYSAGTYYIFSKANGMINITKDKKSAGGWINPNDNK